jgi:hypothetical protein
VNGFPAAQPLPGTTAMRGGSRAAGAVAPAGEPDRPVARVSDPAHIISLVRCTELVDLRVAAAVGGRPAELLIARFRLTWSLPALACSIAVN